MQLGFAEIFGTSANFKHLHTAANLPIADVLHKLRISLNESGSGADSPPPVAGNFLIYILIKYIYSGVFIF